MKKLITPAAFVRIRLIFAVLLLCLSVGVGLFALGYKSDKRVALADSSNEEEPARFLPGGGRVESEADDLMRLEQYWHLQRTYPTGRFNPAWVRRAADQHRRMRTGVPDGLRRSKTEMSMSSLTLDPNSWTALGPMPEKMTGCSGCFDYTTTEGRVDAIAVDPTTTVNGSIVAYLGTDGGGVWKTTNCCSGSTTWTVKTDDPLLSTTAISTFAIDPNDHNIIYAGTGDADGGGAPSGSSQGIIKSTDGGDSWVILGANVFGAEFPVPVGRFPQYNAISKVRIDPNNSSNIVAGTKLGLYFSYDAGINWTGPCLTNAFNTQRQDTTGLELTNMGAGVTRILAAVGARGFGVAVRYDLDQNGANGIYSATMGASGCPSFTSIANNANGFVYGTATAGTPYTTGAPMNAGTGAKYVSATSGNQLSRLDIAVAPSNPNVIYAQSGSIAPNSSSGCGSTTGCQLGAWASTDGGATWAYMAGSQGGALRACAAAGPLSGVPGSGDYPQNWYDQGIVVDPNDPDRVFFDTFDVWFATRTGTNWYDVTCGYSGPSPKPVHVDQHALAFVPGSSGILLLGNDGGTHGTANANAAANDLVRPTWFNMDTGLNTIEYYSGDISANFATSATPQAAGGAQDNMDSFVTFASNPTGPVQWQGNVGGDGFYARIDGKGGYFYASNNNGAIHRCTTNCSGTGAVFGGDIRATGAMRSDRQSFVEPFDLFRGNIGGTGNAECGVRCNHMIVGTYRLWENIAADAAPNTWTARTGDLTKNTAAATSYINDVNYAATDQTLALVSTFDGNVQFVYGLGAAGSTAVNLTDSNNVLPNRPLNQITFDPLSDNTAAHPVTGYVAVAGFNDNTPTTPGHVMRVDCSTVNCTSFTWTNKSGNLPDISASSVAVNPNYPQQVFVGMDFGLYFTNDINAASPVWYRFENGIPHSRVAYLRIDRGNTTISAWTQSRGAYVFPLPTGNLPTPNPLTLVGAVSRQVHGGTPYDIALPGVECRTGPSGDYTIVFTFTNLAQFGGPD